MKVKSQSEVAQSCPTPSDPMDCSLPGSSIHGILQARVLEWGAIAFSIWLCAFNNGFGTSLVVQWLRLCAPSAEGLGLILDQRTRSHMLQLNDPAWRHSKFLCAETKNQCNQINTYSLKWACKCVVLIN